MDGGTENELKYDRVVLADSSNEEDDFSITVNGNEKEDVPAAIAASDHDNENAAAKEAPTEEAATSEPYENSGKEFLGVDYITTSEDLDVKMNVVNEQPMSHKESVVFEINSNDDNGPLRLPVESPERQNTSPTNEEEESESEESCSVPADYEDINYAEYMQLRQELCEDRDKASQRCSLLQMKLAEFFLKKAGEDTQLDMVIQASDQLQEYEKYINILTDLKQQLTTDTETAQQQAEELRLISQEKLDKVENEWQSFMVLKQDVAVRVLSRHLGKEAAQAKVEATLATEKLLQHELTKLRLKHIKLMTNIHRLEAELRKGEKHDRDPLYLQFEQLQAERLELKKHAEKQNEESLKTQIKISSSLELLSNVKEKLFWTQMEVQAKREQLALVEAMVARKRDFLTRTRQARNGLHRDNLRLKEHRGLLGNRVLLRDFEDTVDASDHMEEQLEDLKYRQAEIVVVADGRRSLRQLNE